MTGSQSSELDLVVVGAGPGGIAAATVAAEAGLSVCLLDDNPAPGGQIWRGLRSGDAQKPGSSKASVDWVTRLQHAGSQVKTGTQVIGHPAPGWLRVESRGTTHDVAFTKLILATGARERFLPFPGWTLPGVMGVGGMQALVKGGLDPAGKRIVLAGSGPLLLAVAASMQSAGATVHHVAEQAPISRLVAFALTLLAQPSKLAEGIRYRTKTLRVPCAFGAWVVQAEGRGRVERVTLTNSRKQWTVDCDWLGCSFNLVPNLELPNLLGCAIEAGFVRVNRLQQSSVPRVACIGELTGIGGVEKAILQGQIAGLAAAGRDADAARLSAQLGRQHRFVSRLDRAFALRPELRSVATPETIVCRCEDVPLSALQACGSWREAKLHTRCGMGACQGRVCGAAAESLFGWKDASARPPVFPATVSTLATPCDNGAGQSVMNQS